MLSTFVSSCGPSATFAGQAFMAAPAFFYPEIVARRCPTTEIKVGIFRTGARNA